MRKRHALNTKMEELVKMKKGTKKKKNVPVFDIPQAHAAVGGYSIAANRDEHKPQ
jgi:hypothetical protein